MSLNNEEKRQRKRVNFKLSTVFINDAGTEYDCLLRDVSMSGFYIVTPNIQPEGSSIDIQIILTSGQDTQKVKARCTVIRSVVEAQYASNSGMALHISQIDPDSSIVLYNMIKYQLHNGTFE